MAGQYGRDPIRSRILAFEFESGRVAFLRQARAGTNSRLAPRAAL